MMVAFSIYMTFSEETTFARDDLVSALTCCITGFSLGTSRPATSLLQVSLVAGGSFV